MPLPIPQFVTDRLGRIQQNLRNYAGNSMLKHINDNNTQFYGGDISRAEHEQRLRNTQNAWPSVFQGIQDRNTDAKIKALNLVDMPPREHGLDNISRLGYRNANTQVEVPFGQINNHLQLPARASNDNSGFYENANLVPVGGFFDRNIDQVVIPERTVNRPEYGNTVMRHELDHRAFNKLGNPYPSDKEHAAIYLRDKNRGASDADQHQSYINNRKEAPAIYNKMQKLAGQHLQRLDQLGDVEY